MASVENIEKRLLEIMRRRDPVAVAITGEWGIGKTYFWNHFKENSYEEFGLRKYAYISLFGIDSLDSLKYEIAIKTQGVSQSKDKLKGAKSLFNKALDAIDLSKIEGSGLSLNIGKSLITSTLSNLVSDTVICIDDIERKSDKLSIRDIMGIINDLKLEKSCQVIVILHQERVNDTFQEYKEKVFDEFLIIDDNWKTIENIANNDIILPILKIFYEEIKVRNIRIYEKSIRDYKYIVSNSDFLDKSSREKILKNILILRWIDYSHPVMHYEENKELKVNISYIFEICEKILRNDIIAILPNEEKGFNTLRKYIGSFYSLFLYDDWAKTILDILYNYDISQDSIKNITEKDLYINSKDSNSFLLRQLIDEFNSLKIEDNYCDRLYQALSRTVEIENLREAEYFEFYLNILKNFEREDLAKKFEKDVENLIDKKISVDNYQSVKTNTIQYGSAFHKYASDRVRHIESEIISNKNYQDKIIENKYKSRDPVPNLDEDIEKNIINNITKEKLEHIIWLESPNIKNRFEFIIFVLLFFTKRSKSNKIEEIKGWIIDILNQKSNTSIKSRVPITMFLKHTKNLTEDPNLYYGIKDI